ncbi:hypothetical protein H0H92_000940 [Tricholoma furcatifolium]|nr:hypothetical protein H0H92_000940 [Tricholoma furcatifolium]
MAPHSLQSPGYPGYDTEPSEYLSSNSNFNGNGLITVKSKQARTPLDLIVRDTGLATTPCDSQPCSSGLNPTTLPLKTGFTDNSAKILPQNYRIYQIVGGILGVVVFLSICGFGLYFYRRHRRKQEAETHATGPLQVSFPTSKEAFTSPKYSHYGLSFSVVSSPSTDALSYMPPKLHKPLHHVESISSLRSVHPH